MREDFVDDLRREAERRLVEQQNLRLGHQRAADRQHLLLTAGQRARDLPQPLAQPRKQSEHPVAAAFELRGVAQQIGAELEVFGDRHRGEDAAAFRHQHDAARDATRPVSGAATPRRGTSRRRNWR